MLLIALRDISLLRKITQGKLASVCLLMCVRPPDCTYVEAAMFQDADSQTGIASCSVPVLQFTVAA